LVTTLQPWRRCATRRARQSLALDERGRAYDETHHGRANLLTISRIIAAQTKPRKGPFHHPPARQSHVPSRWHEPLPVDLSPRLGSPGARAARGSRSSGHRRWHRESRGGVAHPWSVGRRNVRLDALPLGVGEIGQIAPFHAQERTSSTHPFAFPNGSSTHSAE
jgi:hypothetical protein